VFSPQVLTSRCYAPTSLTRKQLLHPDEAERAGDIALHSSSAQPDFGLCHTAKHALQPPCYATETPEFGWTKPTVTSIFILTLLEPATALPLLVVMVPGMTDMTIADDPESLSAVFVGWRLSTSRPRWMRNTVCYRGSMLLQRPPPLSLEQISRMPICGTNNRYGDLVSRSSSRLGVVEFDYRR
jgi:hypothetical protein